MANSTIAAAANSGRRARVCDAACPAGVLQDKRAVGFRKDSVDRDPHDVRMEDDRLPGYRLATIPESKLRYCLDPEHRIGRHKARVFQSALGLGSQDAHELERLIRRGLAKRPARLALVLPDATERWVVEWIVAGRTGPLRFVSAWDYHPAHAGPRLVSCYLKRVRSE